MRLSQRDVLIKMLHKENEMRLSPFWQEKFTQVEENKEIQRDWLDVVAEELQPACVDEFLTQKERKNPDCREKALYVLRTAVQRYPDDKEIYNIPLYVKYNRAKRGYLKVGDNAPDVSVYSINNNNNNNNINNQLEKHLLIQNYHNSTSNQSTLPLVIIAGSIT